MQDGKSQCSSGKAVSVVFRGHQQLDLCYGFLFLGPLPRKYHLPFLFPVVGRVGIGEQDGGKLLLSYDGPEVNVEVGGGAGC